MKISRTSYRLFIFSILLALTPTLSMAQGSGGSSSTKSLITVTPEQEAEIDVRSIPAKADQDEQFINDVTARANTLNDGDALKKQLDKLAKSINKLDAS